RSASLPFFCLRLPRPPRPTLFPYTTLFRSAIHVTRALKLARYRIWRGPEGGLWLDDGWGVVGLFSVVYATSGTRVVYAHGQYQRSEEHTSELQSPCNLVCRLLLEK